MIAVAQFMPPYKIIVNDYFHIFQSFFIFVQYDYLRVLSGGGIIPHVFYPVHWQILPSLHPWLLGGGQIVVRAWCCVAYLGRAYIVGAYIVGAYLGGAYIVGAYIVGALQAFVPDDLYDQTSYSIDHP